ncbi:hypothetical protein JCM10213_003893 [Rhodosporidiobolus nylandii]
MELLKRVKYELTGRRLLWNIFFYVGHILIFVYGWWKQATDKRLAGLNTLKYSVWTSRGAGLCLGVDGLFIVLPVLRNIIRALRPALTWIIPLDENLWFHRHFAYSILFFSIVHTTAHYVNMINVERTQIRKETAWAIMYTQPGGFTGHIMLLLMFIMYTLAHHEIRRQCFEAFWYAHHLAIAFLLCFYVHAVGCFVRGALPGNPVRCLGYYSWIWAIWGGIAYSLERLIREIRSRRSTRLNSVLMHPSGTMELRFTKPSFSYKAGQWLFLNVPDVSSLQWHPFTISSAPDDPYVSVHIRQVGDWTMALGNRLGCTPALAAELNSTASGTFPSANAEKSYLRNRSKSDPSDLDIISLGGSTLAGRDGADEYGSGAFYDVTTAALNAGGNLPRIKVDGPFGAPAEDVFKAEVAILVGAGIGVTPFASILKNIWYKQQQGRLGVLRRVHFVWIAKTTGSMSWFNALLRSLEEAQTDPAFLTLSLYLTQPMTADQLTNIAIHTVPSAPHASFPPSFSSSSSPEGLDPITRLSARTQFGRPDFDGIFEAVREGIERGTYLPGRESSLRTTVGVFYCGPNQLSKMIRDKCKAASNASSGSVKFEFSKVRRLS